jgi:hypothetical protein
VIYLLMDRLRARLSSGTPRGPGADAPLAGPAPELTQRAAE